MQFSPRRVLRELRRVVPPGGYVVIVDADRHQHDWTRTAFGDVHPGIDCRRLRRQLEAAGFLLVHTEDAGTFRSGWSVGRSAAFSNFLYVARARDRNRVGRLRRCARQ